MSTVISQREARRLRKRVQELEAENAERLRRWSSEWPGGTSIVSVKWDEFARVPVAIRTARALRHAVVVTVSNDGLVNFIALPIADVRKL